MRVRLALAFLALSFASLAHAQWKALPGQGRDIGVNARGDAWVLGADRVDGGHTIHRWRNNAWERVEGGAVRIDVDPHGLPWVVNAAGDIFRLDNNRWQRMPGRARDIGIGGDGSVWVIGATPVPGGFAVFRWNGTDWHKVPGGALRIDVSPRGEPWLVNDRGEIYRGKGDGHWEKLPGSARAVTVDAAGVAWVLGTDRTDGGHTVHRWTGSGWQRMPGGAVAISAGPEPWVVNAKGTIFRWTGRP